MGLLSTKRRRRRRGEHQPKPNHFGPLPQQPRELCVRWFTVQNSDVPSIQEHCAEYHVHTPWRSFDSAWPGGSDIVREFMVYDERDEKGWRCTGRIDWAVLRRQLGPNGTERVFFTAKRARKEQRRLLEKRVEMLRGWILEAESALSCVKAEQEDCDG